MIDVAYYLFNTFGISTQPGRLMLSKWINVSKEKFNEIPSTVTEAKNDGLKSNLDGREITLDNTENLLRDLGSGKIDIHESGKIDIHEFKEKYNNIADDVEKIINSPTITRNQAKIEETLSLLKEIVEGPLYKQLDTTDMPELESEESDAQRRNQGHGLKILTPNQMLSKWPISLAQLKAGNNSKKLKNEIRQILYSLYRSKKLTKQIYKSLTDII